MWNDLFCHLFFATYLFTYFEAVPWDTCIYNCYISLINWHFSTMKCPSSPLIIYFILKSVSSDQCGHSGILMLTVCKVYLFTSIYFQPTSFYWNYISFRQCIVGYYFLFIHFDNFYLLLGVFSSVIFNVIIGMCFLLPLFLVFKLHPLFLISLSLLSCLLLIYLNFLVLHYRFPPLSKGREFLWNIL